jgi:cell division protein FtsB
MDLPRPSSDVRLRWWLLGGALLALFVWIGFFDSHSLWRRYRWHQEHDRLTQENERLRQDIRRLREQLDRPLSDSLVERIAREEYGMKRPGETMYRLKPEAD